MSGFYVTMDKGVAACILFRGGGGGGVQLMDVDGI